MIEAHRFEDALRFVKKRHRGQRRAGGSPAWHHVARVAHIVRFALETSKEGGPRERQLLSLAALGHDLLEDTKTTEQEVRSIFGDEGYLLISAMTNRWGDNRPLPYVKQVMASDERVKILKLADHCDNFTSAAYSVHKAGVAWATGHFLPIVMPMRRALLRAKFRRFPKTAKHLRTVLNTAVLLLEKEIVYYSGQAPVQKTKERRTL